MMLQLPSLNTCVPFCHVAPTLARVCFAALRMFSRAAFVINLPGFSPAARGSSGFSFVDDTPSLNHFISDRCFLTSSEKFLGFPDAGDLRTKPNACPSDGFSILNSVPVKNHARPFDIPSHGLSPSISILGSPGRSLYFLSPSVNHLVPRTGETHPLVSFSARFASNAAFLLAANSLLLTLFLYWLCFDAVDIKPKAKSMRVLSIPLRNLHKRWCAIKCSLTVSQTKLSSVLAPPKETGKMWCRSPSIFPRTAALCIRP